MPCNQYLFSDNIAILHHYHDYRFVDVLASIDDSLKLVEARPIYLIFDIRESKSPTTLDDYRVLAHYIKNNINYYNRLAIVMDLSNRFQYGMTRQFQTLCDGIGLKLDFFNNLEDSIDFLQTHPSRGVAYDEIINTVVKKSHFRGFKF